MGTISEPGLTVVVGEDDETPVEVYDTDRWLLDLTDRSAFETIEVEIRAERGIENIEGDVSPWDLWLAVVDEHLLPTPTVDGTRREDCDEGDDFGYPSSLLDHLFYQMMLAPDPGADGPSSGFDPCGIPTETDTGPPTCGVDWDGDEVLDEDEPRPTTLLEQVLVSQCTLAGGDFSDVEPYAPADFIDQDSIDLDELPYIDRRQDLGGRRHATGEEAHMVTTLSGGARYVVVVGSGTETGPYTLTIREL
jgi:hypothetical protein